MKKNDRPSVLIMVKDDEGVVTTINTDNLQDHSLGEHVIHAHRRLAAAFKPEIDESIEKVQVIIAQASSVWEMLKDILREAGTPETGEGQDEGEGEELIDLTEEERDNLKKMDNAVTQENDNTVEMTPPDTVITDLPAPVESVTVDPELGTTEDVNKLAANLADGPLAHTRIDLAGRTGDGFGIVRLGRERDPNAETVQGEKIDPGYASEGTAVRGGPVF